MKDNQPTLKQDIAAIWEGGPDGPAQAAQANKHGGRIEKRRLWVSDILVGYSDWPHLAQTCRLERTITARGEPAKRWPTRSPVYRPSRPIPSNCWLCGEDIGGSRIVYIGSEM